MYNKILLSILLILFIIFGVYLFSKNTLIENNSSDKNTTIYTPKEDLSNKNLTQVPYYVFSKTEIEELNLSNNKLTGAIQAEIRHLSNLKVLNISNNQMTGLPAEIGQLKNLEILDVSNNNLTGLPYELGNLQNLKVFNLSGNNYSQQDLEKIASNLPPTVEIIK